MLAILFAFGAALFIWFHDDGSATPAESACHIPEVVVDVEETPTFDFTQQVFERELTSVKDIP